MLAGNRSGGAGKPKVKVKKNPLVGVKGSGTARVVKDTTAKVGKTAPKRTPPRDSGVANNGGTGKAPPRPARGKPVRDSGPKNNAPGRIITRPATATGRRPAAQGAPGLAIARVTAAVEATVAPTPKRRQNARGELTRQAESVKDIPKGPTRSEGKKFKSGAHQLAYEDRRSKAKVARQDLQDTDTWRKAHPADKAHPDRYQPLGVKEIKKVVASEAAQTKRQDDKDIEKHGIPARMGTGPRGKVFRDAARNRRVRVKKSLTPRTKATLKTLEHYNNKDVADKIIQRAARTGEKSISKRMADAVDRSVKDADTEKKIEDKRSDSWLDVPKNALREIKDAGGNPLPIVSELGAVAKEQIQVGANAALGIKGTSGRSVMQAKRKVATPHSDQMKEQYIKGSPIIQTFKHGLKAGKRALILHPVTGAGEAIPILKGVGFAGRVAKAGSVAKAAEARRITRIRPTVRVTAEKPKILKGKEGRQRLRQDLQDAKDGKVPDAIAVKRARPYSQHTTVRVVQKGKDKAQASRGKDPVRATGRKAATIQKKQLRHDTARIDIVQRKQQADIQTGAGVGDAKDASPDLLRRQRGETQVSQARADRKGLAWERERYKSINNPEEVPSRIAALQHAIDSGKVYEKQFATHRARLAASDPNDVRRLDREADRFANKGVEEARHTLEVLKEVPAAFKATSAAKAVVTAARQRADVARAKYMKELRETGKASSNTTTRFERTQVELERAVKRKDVVYKEYAWFKKGSFRADARSSVGAAQDAEQILRQGLTPEQIDMRLRQQWGVEHGKIERDHENNWVDPRTGNLITPERIQTFPRAPNYWNYGIKTADDMETVLGQTGPGSGFQGTGAHVAGDSVGDMQGRRDGKASHDYKARQLLKQSFGGEHGAMPRAEATAAARRLSSSTGRKHVIIKAGIVDADAVKNVGGRESKVRPKGGEDVYIVAPAPVAKHFQQTTREAGRALNASRAVSRGFYRGVLALNPAWIAANLADEQLRTRVAGVRKKDGDVYRKFKKDIGIGGADASPPIVQKAFGDEYHAEDVARRRDAVHAEAVKLRDAAKAEKNPRLREMMLGQAEQKLKDLHRIGEGTHGVVPGSNADRDAKAKVDGESAKRKAENKDRRARFDEKLSKEPARPEPKAAPKRGQAAKTEEARRLQSEIRVLRERAAAARSPKARKDLNDAADFNQKELDELAPVIKAKPARSTAPPPPSRADKRLQAAESDLRDLEESGAAGATLENAEAEVQAARKAVEDHDVGKYGFGTEDALAGMGKETPPLTDGNGRGVVPSAKAKADANIQALKDEMKGLTGNARKNVRARLLRAETTQAADKAFAEGPAAGQLRAARESVQHARLNNAPKGSITKLEAKVKRIEDKMAKGGLDPSTVGLPPEAEIPGVGRSASLGYDPEKLKSRDIYTEYKGAAPGTIAREVKAGKLTVVEAKALHDSGVLGSPDPILHDPGAPRGSKPRGPDDLERPNHAPWDENGPDSSVPRDDEDVWAQEEARAAREAEAAKAPDPNDEMYNPGPPESTDPKSYYDDLGKKPVEDWEPGLKDASTVDESLDPIDQWAAEKEAARDKFQAFPDNPAKQKIDDELNAAVSAGKIDLKQARAIRDTLHREMDGPRDAEFDRPRKDGEEPTADEILNGEWTNPEDDPGPTPPTEGDPHAEDAPKDLRSWDKRERQRRQQREMQLAMDLGTGDRTYVNQTFNSARAHMGANTALQAKTVERFVNSGPAKLGMTKGGRLTTLGEFVDRKLQPIRGNAVVRAHSALVDASLGAGSRIEANMTDRIQGKVLRTMAKEMEMDVNESRALAKRILSDPAAARRFNELTTEIIGDYINRAPTLAGDIAHQVVPFLPWMKASLKWTMLTLPARHPLKLSLLVLAGMATEHQRRLIGMSDFISKEEAESMNLPAPVDGFLGGGLTVAPGWVVPAARLFSFAEPTAFSEDPLGHFGRYLFPQFGSIGAKVLGKPGTLPGYALKKASDATGLTHYNQDGTGTGPLDGALRFLFTYMPGSPRVASAFGFNNAPQGGLGPSQTGSYDEKGVLHTGRPKNVIGDRIGLGAQSILETSPKLGYKGEFQVGRPRFPKGGKGDPTGDYLAYDAYEQGFKNKKLGVQRNDDPAEAAKGPRVRAREGSRRVALDFLNGTQATRTSRGALDQTRKQLAINDKMANDEMDRMEGRTPGVKGWDPKLSGPSDFGSFKQGTPQSDAWKALHTRLDKPVPAKLKGSGADKLRQRGKALAEMPAGAKRDRMATKLSEDIKRHTRYLLGHKGAGPKVTPTRTGIVPIPFAKGEEVNASALDEVVEVHRLFGVGVSDAFDRTGRKHKSAGHIDPKYGDAVDFVGTPAQTDNVAKWAVKRGYTVYYDGRLGTTAQPNHGPGHHIHVEFGSGPNSSRRPGQEGTKVSGKPGSVPYNTVSGLEGSTPGTSGVGAPGSNYKRGTGGDAKLRRMAREAAKRAGLNPDFFEAQINQESGFRTGLTSSMGAQGVAQIMPKTAKSWGVNPNDPAAALKVAAREMKKYVDKYGEADALRAYNAGERGMHKGYAETENYVKTILGGGGGAPSGGGTSSSSSGGSTSGGSTGGGSTSSAPSKSGKPQTPAEIDAAVIAAQSLEDPNARADAFGQIVAMLNGGTVSATGDIIAPSKGNGRIRVKEIKGPRTTTTARARRAAADIGRIGR